MEQIENDRAKDRNMKTLLKNAKIYDGSGSEPFFGDVFIADDKIEKVAAAIDADADRIIDLQGKSLSSGFIDAHSHNDWFAIKKDPLPYFEPFIRQGIATFVAGNYIVVVLYARHQLELQFRLAFHLLDLPFTVVGLYIDHVIGRRRTLLQAVNSRDPFQQTVGIDTQILDRQGLHRSGRAVEVT